MKKISKSLSSRIKANSIFASSILLLNSQTKSQIIYTDIDPDELYGGSYFDPAFYLDINNDGYSDYTIKGWEKTYNTSGGSSFSWTDTYTHVDEVSIILPPINQVAIYKSFYYNWEPYAFDYGALINNSNVWNDDIDQNILVGAYQHSHNGFPSGYSIFGNWRYVTEDKYVGFKFQVDDNFYFGWLRLQIGPTNNKFTVKDYAYNAIPNSGIYAGELISSVENNPNEFHLLQINNEIILNFSNQAQIENKFIEIFDVTGKIIYHSALSSNPINTNDFSKGIYVVRIVEKNNTIFAQKILL